MYPLMANKLKYKISNSLFILKLFRKYFTIFYVTQNQLL